MKKWLVLLGVVFGIRGSVYQFQVREWHNCHFGAHRCFFPFKNPARLSSQAWGLSSPAQKPKSSGLGSSKATISTHWRQQLWSKTQRTPVVAAIQSAVWQGDLQGLPFWLIQKYQGLGLLPVLALSGQHVGALAGVLGALFFLVGRWRKPRSGWWLLRGRQAKLPCVAFLLLTLAPGEHSLLRTFWCVLLIFFIQKIPLAVHPLFIVSTGCGVLLLFFPQLLISRGFVLSLFGVMGVLIAQYGFSEKKLKKVLWLILWFSGGMAFFFGEWISWGIVHQSVLAWVWDTVILPITFLIGITLGVVPEGWSESIALGSEWVLNQWLDWESQHLVTYKMQIVRFTEGEILLFSAWLIALALWNRKGCQSAPK